MSLKCFYLFKLVGVMYCFLMKIGYIFLVDDDLDDCEFFLFVLEKVGSFIVMEVCDGCEVFDKLEDVLFEFDIIFLDINMFRVNGREFFVKL